VLSAARIEVCQVRQPSN